jgi:hypothetical protein
MRSDMSTVDLIGDIVEIKLLGSLLEIMNANDEVNIIIGNIVMKNTLMPLYQTMQLIS